MSNDAFQLFALILAGTAGLSSVIAGAFWAALVVAERLAVVLGRPGRRDVEAPRPPGRAERRPRGLLSTTLDAAGSTIVDGCGLRTIQEFRELATSWSAGSPSSMGSR